MGVFNAKSFWIYDFMCIDILVEIFFTNFQPINKLVKIIFILEVNEWLVGWGFFILQRINPFRVI